MKKNTEYRIQNSECGIPTSRDNVFYCLLYYTLTYSVFYMTIEHLSSKKATDFTDFLTAESAENADFLTLNHKDTKAQRYKEF